MRYGNKLSIGLVLLFLMSIVACSDDDVVVPESNSFQPLEQEVDQDGGRLESGDYAIEIPAGALESTATISLSEAEKPVGSKVEEVFIIESMPLSLMIEGAALLDTIYVELPAFEGDLEGTVVGMENNGEWFPLAIDTSSINKTRAIIPPGLLANDKFGSPANFFKLRIRGLGTTGVTVTDWEEGGSGRQIILLVHGILSTGENWDTEILSELERYGDVWLMTYPWLNHFDREADIALDVVAEYFPGQEVNIVAHSKGGLLSRSMVRKMGGSSVLIRKVAFLGTPHYGSPVGDIVRVACVLYPRLSSLLLPILLEIDGIDELSPGSEELNALNDSSVNLGGAVEYRCIVGNVLGLGGDGIVARESADLALPIHNGNHEGIVFYPTWDSDSAHCDFTSNWSPQLQTTMQSFLEGNPNASGWSEGFEDDTAGSFPSTWSPDANAISDPQLNSVDSQNTFEGNGSLRLFGSIGSCWGALAYRPLDIDAPYEVTVTMKNGSEELSGCHPDRGGFGLRAGQSWNLPARTFIQVKGDGTIMSSSGELDLGTDGGEEWINYRIRYERPDPTHVRLTYWINGTFKGSECLESIENEGGLSHFSLYSQEGSVWFDSVDVTPLLK